MPTSNDLMNKHFEKANFGGYKAADVDEFMEDLRMFISEKTREINELKKRLDTAEKKAAVYSNGEESIKNTLLNAQVLADKITKDAKEKAEKLLNDATTTAESKVRSAQIKAENLIDCAQSEVEMRKNEAETIKTEVYNFKLNLMKLYRAQLELIHDIPAENPETSETSEKTTPEEAPETVIAPSENEEQAEPSKEVEADTEESSETLDNETGKDSFDDSPKNPPRSVVPMESVVTYGKYDKPDDTEEEPSKPSNNVEEPATKDTAAEENEPQESVDTTAANTEAVDTAIDTAKDEVAAQDVTAPEVRTVKLNLRYNEKTGEYEPLGATHSNGTMPQAKGKNGDGLKFGADYNISTDSFDRK